MINLNSIGAQSGLLRGVLSGKVDSAIAAAGSRPAIQALVQEPLSRKTPEGTAQVIANKPSLSFEELRSILADNPVPTPQEAAQLIQAMVTPPTPGSPVVRQAPTAAPRTVAPRRVAPSAKSAPRALYGAGPLLPGQSRVGGYILGGPLGDAAKSLSRA